MRYSTALRSGVLGVILSLALCAVAQGQAPTSSLADVSQLVQPGQRIEVTRQDGSVVTGGLTRVSGALLVLDVEGKPVEVPASTVAEISRRGDTVLNGLGAGASVGLLAGFLLSAVMAGSETDEGFGSVAKGMVPLGLGVGSGLGVALDYMLERKTVVFRASPGTHVALAPILGKNRKGLALSMRF